MEASNDMRKLRQLIGGHENALIIGSTGLFDINLDKSTTILSNFCIKVRSCRTTR